MRAKLYCTNAYNTDEFRLRTQPRVYAITGLALRLHERDWTCSALVRTRHDLLCAGTNKIGLALRLYEQDWTCSVPVRTRLDLLCAGTNKTGLALRLYEQDWTCSEPVSTKLVFQISHFQHIAPIRVPKTIYYAGMI